MIICKKHKTVWYMDICFLPQTLSFLTESRQRPATSRLSGQQVGGPQDHHQSSSDKGWELGPQASQCYTGFSHRPERLVAYASQGLLPHISHRSPSFQGISPGSPIKGLPSVAVGVTQPQTDSSTKCFDYIYTFLYDSFNCGTINYLKTIDGL